MAAGGGGERRGRRRGGGGLLGGGKPDSKLAKPLRAGGAQDSRPGGRRYDFPQSDGAHSPLGECRIRLCAAKSGDFGDSVYQPAKPCTFVALNLAVRGRGQSRKPLPGQIN